MADSCQMQKTHRDQAKLTVPPLAEMLPSALIFDFDGLICDTESCLLEAGQEVFAAHGVTLPFDRWLDLVGTSTPPNFWVPWLEELLETKVDEPEVMAAFDRHNQTRTKELLPNDGVVELLNLATESGIALGVASSSSIAWVGDHLDQLGLKSYFSEIVTRGDVMHAKPAPDLYLLAAHRLGLKPGDCVAFEDSHNGSLAAIRAGIPCVVVPNSLTRHQDLTHATLRVPTLDHVTLELLGRIRTTAQSSAT